MLNFKTFKSVAYTTLFLIAAVLTIINVSLIESHLDEFFFINVLDLAVSTLILTVIYFMIKKTETMNSSITRLNSILGNSPLYYIYSCDGKNVFEISSDLQKLLRFENMQIKSLKKLSAFFSFDEWEKIEYLINNPTENVKTLNGVISLKEINENLKYVNYYVQVQKVEQKIMVSFWFLNITQEKESEVKVVEYIHRYRNLSYSLETIINRLPFPVWRVNESKQIEYYNESAVLFLQEHGLLKGKEEEFIIEAIKEFCEGCGLKNSQSYAVKKHLYKNGEPKHYLINSDALPNSLDHIIYIQDITQFNNVEKTQQEDKQVAKSIINLSEHAILCIDNEQRIFNFNKAICKLFSIDASYLENKPLLSKFLDVITANGNFDIAESHEKYKEKLITSLYNISERKEELIQLNNGETLKLQLIPMQGLGVILIYQSYTKELGRKNSFAELQNAYNQLLEFVEEPLMVVQESGSLSYINGKFKELFKDYSDEKNNFADFLNVVVNEHNVSNDTATHFKDKMQQCFYSHNVENLDVKEGDIQNIRMIYLNNRSVMVIFNNKKLKKGNNGEKTKKRKKA